MKMNTCTLTKTILRARSLEQNVYEDFTNVAGLSLAIGFNIFSDIKNVNEKVNKKCPK